MSELIKRIRETCGRRGWYAQQAEGSTLHSVNADDPRRSGFVCKTATEQPLRDTAQSLGFSLPPLLSTLYQSLANGGFGPGYGLREVLEGYAPGETVLDYYPERSKPVQFLERGESGIDWEAYFVFHRTYCPRQLVPLCHWGCGIEMCVDCTTEAGQIFRLAPPQDEHWIMTRISLSLFAGLA